MMALTRITDGVHAFHYEAGGFPCRSTLLETDDGLLLVSPGPIDDALAEEIGEVGAVRAILAPNLFHHLHAAAAAERFGDAEVWAAPGLSEKLSDERFARVLDDARSLGAEIEWLHLEGVPKSQEIVLLHRPSRSLVTTDLIMNVTEAGFAVRTLLRLFGAYNRPRTSQLWRFLSKDRPALTACLEQIGAWDFDRIVVGHGHIVESDAKDTFAEATGWLRELGKSARVTASA